MSSLPYVLQSRQEFVFVLHDQFLWNGAGLVYVSARTRLHRMCHEKICFYYLQLVEIQTSISATETDRDWLLY